MPTLGGAPTSKGLFRHRYQLYLGPASTNDNSPKGPLGATDPGAPWVKQGRLKDEELTWNVPSPSYLEMRAGFQKILKARVVNQAEMPVITANLDETDPNVLAWLRGNSAATSLSSSTYTGAGFTYKTGQQYSCQVLFVGIDADTNNERHVYGGRATVTFKMTSDSNGVAGVQADVTLLDVSTTETFKINDWNDTTGSVNG